MTEKVIKLVDGCCFVRLRRFERIYYSEYRKSNFTEDLSIEILRTSMFKLKLFINYTENFVLPIKKTLLKNKFFEE